MNMTTSLALRSHASHVALLAVVIGSCLAASSSAHALVAGNRSADKTVFVLSDDLSVVQHTVRGDDGVVSPDGRLLSFVHGRNRYLRILHFATGQILEPVGLRCVSTFWAPDGSRLVCVENTRWGRPVGVYVVDSGSGQHRRVARLSSPTHHGSVSPDGSRFAYSAETGIHVLDLATGRKRFLGRGGNPTWGPKYFAAVRCVATSDYLSTCRILRSPSAEPSLRGAATVWTERDLYIEKEGIAIVRWHDENRLLCDRSSDGGHRAALLDVQSASYEELSMTSGGVSSAGRPAALSPDGTRLLVWNYDEAVRVEGPAGSVVTSSGIELTEVSTTASWVPGT